MRSDLRAIPRHDLNWACPDPALHRLPGSRPAVLRYGPALLFPSVVVHDLEAAHRLRFRPPSISWKPAVAEADLGAAYAGFPAPSLGSWAASILVDSLWAFSGLHHTTDHSRQDRVELFLRLSGRYEKLRTLRR